MTNPHLKPVETTLDATPADPLADANRREARAAIDAERAGDEAAVRRLITEPSDRFDPTALRLNPDSAEGIVVKKLLTSVPVRNPKRHDWVRVRPEPEHSVSGVGLIKFGDDREFYLVRPQIAAELLGEFARYSLFTTINRQGTLFLWPIRLPDSDGRQMEWHRSAHEAAVLATEGWIRIAANMNLGAYDIYSAEAAIPDPEWPSYSLRDLLEKAFANRMIDRADHAVIQQLRGRV
jgi:hypothetical protein